MSLRPRPGRHASALTLKVAVAAVLGVAALAACSDSPPSLSDLPPGVAQARPQISAEEASFVLAAKARGVDVTGATVNDDVETGTTTCWALKNGNITLGELAVDDTGKPLGNDGDELRTKELMAAAVDALCPGYAKQVPQLHLPG